MYIYAPQWGLSTLAKEFTAASRIMQSSLNELSTLVSGTRSIFKRSLTGLNSGSLKLVDKFTFLGSTVSSSENDRKEEITLSRLQIGHTMITHSYLLEGK